MFAEFVFRVFPGGPVASHEYEKGQIGLFGFLFHRPVVRFNSLAVRTPVASIFVLLASEEHDCFGLVGDQMFKNFFKFVKGDQLAHLITYSHQSNHYISLIQHFCLRQGSHVFQVDFCRPNYLAENDDLWFLGHVKHQRLGVDKGLLARSVDFISAVFGETGCRV